MDFKRIIEEILKGNDIEQLMERIDWKEFEAFCAKILEEHDWNVQKNYRFKNERRYEIDLLAKKGRLVLAIDCKHWGIRQGKSTQLRYAVEKQMERTKALSNVKTLDSIGKQRRFHSLIITMLKEDIESHNDVWIVPVFSLNNFLLEIENYLDS